MQREKAALAALAYARTAQPLDPDMGWRREDVQLAFMAGMEAKPVPRLLSLKEVATILNASPSTVQQLVVHGELAFLQIGRGTERKRMAFSPSDIEALIRRKTERIGSVRGLNPTRVIMHAEGLSFTEARELRIQQRREKKERERRDAAAAVESKRKWDALLEEKAKKDADRKAATERNAAAREAKRKAKEAKGE